MNRNAAPAVCSMTVANATAVRCTGPADVAATACEAGFFVRDSDGSCQSTLRSWFVM